MLSESNQQDRYYIGICELDLHMQDCHSLKDKRRVIAGLKEKLKNRYNIGLCEFGDLSLWQRTQLAVIACSNERSVVDSTFRAVKGFIAQLYPAMLVNASVKIM
jgi:uncharacterized protein YlxP (DUF503 family)